MCATIAATIELWPNAQAPIYQLPVRDVVQGFYWRTDFTLPFGRVIHDYLVTPDTQLHETASVALVARPASAHPAGD